MTEVLMTLWLKREFGAADFGPAFDHFGALFIALGGPEEMILVTTGPIEDQTFFARVPDGAVAGGLTEFSPANEDEIGTKFTCLIGHDEEREALRARLIRAA
jgi:hypothetical protein